MEVFIIPQSDLEHLVDEEGNIKDITGQEEDFKQQISEYESELAELEWKHSQLSKSYKELFNKQNKTRKKNKELEAKVESLESDREKLISVLQKVKEAKNQASAEDIKSSKPSVSSIISNESDLNQDQGKTQPFGIKLDKTQVNPEGKIPADKITTESKEEKEDKDIWTVLRSRLTKKEEDEK